MIRVFDGDTTYFVFKPVIAAIVIHRVVIGISEFTSKEEIKKAFDSGFSDYLVKPIDLAVLSQVIKNQLSK
jgi:PleD family two-component response regulator